MTVKPPIIEKIARPRLLVQAARIAAKTYKRDRDLGRLLRSSPTQSHYRNISRLSDLEYELDQSRRIDNTTYSISHHVEILAALLAELQGRPKGQPG